MTKQVEIGRKWHDVPDKARWLAQDADGRWWWYQFKPKVGSVDNMWWQPRRITTSVWRRRLGLICVGVEPKNWKEELYKLIDKD